MLETKLDTAVVGHRLYIQFLLKGIPLLLGSLSVFLTSFIGAFFILNVIASSLNDFMGEPVDINHLIVIESLISVVTLIIAIGTATARSFSKSLSITLIVSILLAVISFFILEAQNRLPPEFLLTLISGVLVSLLIAYFSFFIFRLAYALANITGIRCHLFMSIAVVTMLVPTIVGSLAALNTLQADENALGKIFSALSASQLNQIRMATILVGVVFSLGIASSAWKANRRRNVPWRYPDPLRTLALNIGSWQGKSFYKLDVSEMSFRGTNLANTDLRAQKLYRTCFQDVTGLERARVDNHYLDLEIPRVQKLLTQATSDEPDYSCLNLRGAYLQGADLRRISFIDTDLSGADLQTADLRGAILARTQVIGVDFSNANLTGICIKDWSVNDQTLFTNVVCDYVYRDLDEKGEPTDRYPADRNFEPQEFESLYQEIGNVAELVFKEGVNWRALGFSMQKLDLEDEGLGLELKGFEQRGDRWVVRVTHNQHIPKQVVEARLLNMYDEMRGLLAAKEEQIHQLLGITSDQAESIKELSQKPFGNSFFITGSTITNLTGSGNIEYTEAAHQVREIISHGRDRKQAAPIANQFARQLKQQAVATKQAEQLELIQQLIVAEANDDPAFREYLLNESQQIIQTMAGTPLTQVIHSAIQILTHQK